MRRDCLSHFFRVPYRFLQYTMSDKSFRKSSDNKSVVDFASGVGVTISAKARPGTMSGAVKPTKNQKATMTGAGAQRVAPHPKLRTESPSYHKVKKPRSARALKPQPKYKETIGVVRGKIQ
jgi:hypothetical protein